MKNKNKGFTLVELLVTLVITMTALLVIGETQIQTEKIRRTSQGNQGAQYNGLLASQLIDQGIKKTGFGLNDVTFIGSIINYHNPFTSADETEVMAPALIEQDGDNVKLRLMWSTSNANMVPLKLLNTKLATTNTVQVSNTYGMASGDLLLYAEAGKDASVHQITGTVPANEEVQHATSTTYPWNSDLTDFYPTDGYTSDARVLNLGRWERQTFSVVNNQLWLKRSSTGGESSALLADNIVRFQALYGMDDGTGTGEEDDGVPDAFVTTTPTDAATWARVVAIRFIVLSRTAEMERDVVTTAAPAWSGGSFDLSAMTNWNRYRYRVYESTVPIRNAVWTVPAA
jgi:type IV pilus assembly protein PilW